MGNQGSTGYLVSQLFSSQLLGLCQNYGATPVTLLCGAVVFSYLGLEVHPGSVLEMLDHGARHAWYPSKTYALHWQAVTIMIILIDMWENGCGMEHS